MTCWLPLTTAYRRVGVLSFGSRSDAAYTADALAFMEQVAAVVAIAVDNGINHEQAQRYARELQEERDQMRFLLDVNNLLVRISSIRRCSRQSAKRSGASSRPNA